MKIDDVSVLESRLPARSPAERADARWPSELDRRASGRRQPLRPVSFADLDPEHGLIGDHYRGRTNRSRQVTLIEAEHLVAIGAYLDIGPIEPDRLRRNIVVSGINLHALKSRQFLLGSAVLVATGECHPCSRMEEILGPGGYNAVRGHGGITARIVRAGRVYLGDPIVRDADMV